MIRNQRPGRSWIAVGGALALVGMMIIIWPERGLVPHPLPFPPSAATRPIADWAVFGYPLVAVGALIAFMGAVRAALAGLGSGQSARGL